METNTEEIIEQGRHSLKGLPASIRKDINLYWFKQEPTWKEKFLEPFPEDPFDNGFPTDLVWQDDYCWGGPAGDYIGRVPCYKYSVHSRREHVTHSAGFVYERTKTHLKVYHVHAYVFDGYQDQLIIELLPSKERIRRLQALLDHLVVPYLNHRETPVEIDWNTYYRYAESGRDKRKAQNHWKSFFGR